MIAEYNKLAIYYNKYGVTRENVETAPFKRMRYIYSIMTPDQRKSAEDMPPPPPPLPPGSKNGDVPPPPPPPPPSPIEAVKKWTEEGADFFYNGKKVTAQKAQEIVQKNNGKNLSVKVEENASGKTVRLSDNKK